MRENASRKKLILSGAAIASTGILLGAYLSREGIDYRDLIVAAGILVAGIIVFGGERGIHFGLVLWTLSMALGYRTVEWSPALRIHPAELLLWLLLACVFAQRRLVAHSKVSLPLWLLLFVPFWALGWWPLILGEAKWDAMFNEFRDFLLFIPLLIVVPIVLERQRNWRYVVAAFFLASTWIAFMGVLEYWFPSVTQFFPAFIKNAKAEPTADGFIRAQFSFWGNQTATFVCALAVPAGIVLIVWCRKFLQRLAILLASSLQLVAIYIGGFRSVWLMVVIQVTAACLFGLRKHGLAAAALCIVVAGIGYQYIPKTSERVITAIAVLKGTPIDHSGQDRMDRAAAAIQHTIDSPVGTGWNSAGWVHSDFLQVAANLGIIAAVIFIGGYLYTLFQMASKMKKLRSHGRGEHLELGFSLLLSFIAVGGLLAMEGVEVLPQLILPVWFVWALVEVWLRQTSEAPELCYSYAPPSLYPAANFQ